MMTNHVVFTIGRDRMASTRIGTIRIYEMSYIANDNEEAQVTCTFIRGSTPNRIVFYTREEFLFNLEGAIIVLTNHINENYCKCGQPKITRGEYVVRQSTH